MGHLTVLDNLMEEKLMNMNTAFIGKITAIKKNSATIQPLNKVKQYGKTAQKQSVLLDVPILNHTKYKYEPYKLKYVKDVSISTTSADGYLTSASLNVTKDEVEIVERKELKAGDVVLCVCSDRDITETKNGTLATPSVGRHHNMSDAIIVGVIK